MGIFKKLTPLGRLVAIILIVGVAGFATYKLTNNGKDLSKISLPSVGNSYDATLLVDTYTGWAPIVWGNGGKDGSTDSYFYKNFGVKLKIMQMDDFDGATAYWKENKDALRFCTLDSFPVEASSSGTMTDARYFVIHNFSAGADAIVVTKNIKTVADLKGKKIAFSEGTASHSLLLNTLEAAGLNGSDVEQVKTGYGTDVATTFKAKQVDAAVVFTPDDEACISAVPGAHVLTSTRQASTLVTDGFLAHPEWLEANPKVAKKIIQALCWANSEITNSKEAYNEACEVFAREFEVPLEDVVATGQKINFATFEDNVNWFGLNTLYTGIDGNSLYTKMSRVYAGLGLAKATLPWNRISYSKYIEELMDDNSWMSNIQTPNATKEKSFEAPSKEVQTAEAISNKKVIINFPVNGFTLDDDAQTLIEREFLPIVQQFNNVYVRIEGNTDNTGNYDSNVVLSKKRAQSVADYLVKQGVDEKRFVVVGNGPDRAIKDGVKGSSQDYRTTDLQLIGE